MSDWITCIEYKNIGTINKAYRNTIIIEYEGKMEKTDSNSNRRRKR
jgi:hypothetical protein